MDVESETDATQATDPAAADARQRVAAIPSGTGLRFLLLVAAVLATSAVMFTWSYTADPDRAQSVAVRFKTCVDRYPDADLKTTTTAEFLERKAPAARQLGRCTAPVFRDLATWVGVQLAAEVALAGALYALHPWWIRRRRGLVALEVDDPALAAELRDLCTRVGLERQPTWLLAPFRAGTGGLAFGTRRRRYVSLDAGLVTRWTTDRPAFRAVVLHELAHHRHGDAARTYATIAVWWAFVTAAIVPYLLFLIHPMVLSHPFSWSPDLLVKNWSTELRAFAALAILTPTVYLIRNAVLRVRETYADAAAATAAGPDSALARVLGTRDQAAAPAWRAPLRTHPTVAQRLAVIADPARLAQPSGWEMFAAGLTGALLAVNLTSLVPNLFTPSVLIGDALISVPVVALLVGLLATALSRTTARPGPRSWVRRWSLPVALVAGFVAGTPLSVQMSILRYKWASWAYPVSIGLLLAGAVTVTGYLLSVVRSLPDRSARARRAALTALVVATFPWFLIWFGARGTETDTVLITGGRPDPGGDIGWYAALAHWTQLLYPPLTELENNPFTLPGLALLWAVPAVVSRAWRPAPETAAGSRPPRWAFALAVGATAGLAVVAFGVAEQFLARDLLPAAVRRVPGNVTVDSPPFYLLVALNTYVTVAVVAQGVAAAVTAGRSDRLRPVLALLAATATGVLATFGVYAMLTTARCLNVNANPASHCRPASMSAGEFGMYLHLVLIRGIVVVVPATLVGAGLAAWRRRARTGRPGDAGRVEPEDGGRVEPEDGGRVEPEDAGRVEIAPRTAGRRPSTVLTTVALSGLLAVVLAATAVRVPVMYRAWVPDDLTGTACLAGTWVEVDHHADVDLGQAGTAGFAGSGAVQTFGADGTATLDYGPGVTESATVNGHHVEIVFVGRITMRYHGTAERIDYRDVSASGGYALRADGQTLGTYPLGTNIAPDRYTCINDYLHQDGPGYRILLKRQRR